MDSPCQSLSILYQNEEAYGIPLAEALRDGYEEENSVVPAIPVTMVPYEPNRAEYADVIDMLSPSFLGGECIALVGYAADAGRIFVDYMSQYGSRLNQPRWITADGNKSTNIYVEEARPLLFGTTDMEGNPIFHPLIGTAPAPGGRVEQRDFENAYVATFGGSTGDVYSPPRQYSSNQYDAAAMVFLAIESAGSLDGRAIRDAIQRIGPDSGRAVVPATSLVSGLSAIREGRTIDYSGASGAVDFDANGDITTATTRIEVWQATPAGEMDLDFTSDCTVAPNRSQCEG